jgi:tetratricopeptide (TPR) repeat protein
MVELVAMKQQERDARADMRLGDYIMTHLASEQVFVHIHHPNLGLFALMLREVFSRMGCSSAEIERALSHYRSSPFPVEELPIHPRIAEHFGLKWARDDLKYRFAFGERVTWDEYCQRYIAHDWSEHLQCCLARAHRDLPCAELEALATELETASARYDSSEGYFALSATRQRLGDLAGSLDAILLALRSDPLSVGYVTRHAELLLATGHMEEALAAAEDVVVWQPQFAPARIALLETHYRLGQRQEALQEARAAFALAPLHPHVVRRLEELEIASRGSG